MGAGTWENRVRVGGGGGSGTGGGKLDSQGGRNREKLRKISP